MVLLLTLLVAIPQVGFIFGLTPIGLNYWLVAMGLSLLPTVVSEIGKKLDQYFYGWKEKEYQRRIVKHRIEEDDF